MKSRSMSRIRVQMRIAASGLLMAFVAPASFASDPAISLMGDCPGQVEVRWSGATASRIAVLCFSQELGDYLLPGGPCGGTLLGLGSRGIRVARYFRTGPNGEGAIRGHAAPIACGGYLQMVVVDASPCTTSNVAQIP